MERYCSLFLIKTMTLNKLNTIIDFCIENKANLSLSIDDGTF